MRSTDQEVYADAGYQGACNHSDASVDWHIAMRPGKRRALNKTQMLDQLIDAHERVKAQIRASAEHAFRVVKQQFGFTKTRLRGMAKNQAKLHMLFMLSNLWMVRKKPEMVLGHGCA